MPRLLKLAVPALAALAEQLRFAPPPAARGHVQRAERLLALIDPAQAYPEDWVAFQLTGFRPAMGTPELIPGEALAGDIAGLIDRLCAGAGFTADEHASPGWVSTAELCQRWGVSRKTIERLRRAGLVGRRVATGGGRAQTRFALPVVERFERAHARRLARAGARTRLSDEDKQSILRQAENYRQAFGSTRTAAAGRIARTLGRAREAVRRVLIEHDESAAKPIFTPEPRLGVRQRRFILRARGAGASPMKLAARLGISVSTVHRLSALALAERLRAVRVPIAGELLELVTKEEASILANPAACAPLGAPGEQTLGEHAAAALVAGQPERSREGARLLAYFALLARAQRVARGLSRTRPSARAIDKVLTDLRWAARLKAELARDLQLLVLRTIEVQLAQHGTGPRGLLGLQPSQAGALLRACIEAVAAVIDRFDPGKGGRLAAPAGIEVNRVVAQWLARTAPMLGASGGAPLQDWTRRVCPWQAFTEPPTGTRAILLGLSPAEAQILTWRLGWSGPPRTRVEIARALGTTDAAVARLERRLLLMRSTTATPGPCPAR